VATTYDASNNPIANVTGSTIFNMTNGTCSGAGCTPSAAGIQTVTGTYGSFNATATLSVTSTAPGAAQITATAAKTDVGQVTVTLTNTGSGPANNISGTVTLRRLSGTGQTPVTISFGPLTLLAGQSTTVTVNLSPAPATNSRYAVTETGTYTDPNANPSGKNFSLSQTVIF
jgi:hypothetical protein